MSEYLIRINLVWQNSPFLKWFDKERMTDDHVLVSEFRLFTAVRLLSVSCYTNYTLIK